MILINTATGEGVQIEFYDANFTDESIQSVYNSMPIPGEIDQIQFAGLKSPSGSIKLYFEGDTVVDKIEKIKRFVSDNNDRGFQIIFLKVLNIPIKKILITQVNTTYPLNFVKNGRLTRAISSISYIELKEEQNWWQKLLDFRGSFNTSTMPPDVEKLKSDNKKLQEIIDKNAKSNAKSQLSNSTNINR